MDRPVVLRTALQFVEAGRFFEALALCEPLLRDAEETSVLRIKAAALAGLGRGEEAVAALQRARTLAPGEADTFVVLGCVLGGLGRGQDALGAYDEAVKLAPDGFEARYRRGSLRLKLGDERGAVEDFKRAAAASPELKARIDKIIAESGEPGSP
jgi:tetratricopeptide (TPR) repeat protein